MVIGFRKKDRPTKIMLQKIKDQIIEQVSTVIQVVRV